MARPKLLMLDEPSLGLAPLIVREIFHIIEELKRRGASILLVEQNARAALPPTSWRPARSRSKGRRANWRPISG